jgi:hypothetical protein
MAHRFMVLLARIGLGAATVIVGLNLWTGLPLLALWVGSQAAGGSVLSMTGVVVAVVSLAALLTAGVIVLSRISVGYDRLIGRPAPVRQPAPWLLSINAATAQPEQGRQPINAVEAIIVTLVVVAVVAFEIWFFFLARGGGIG